MPLVIEHFNEDSFPPAEGTYEYFNCECAQPAGDDFPFMRLDTLATNVGEILYLNCSPLPPQFFTSILFSNGFSSFFTENGVTYPGIVAEGDAQGEYAVVLQDCNRGVCVARPTYYTGNSFDFPAHVGPNGDELSFTYDNPIPITRQHFTPAIDQNIRGRLSCYGIKNQTSASDFFDTVDATKASFGIGLTALIFAFMAFIAAICGRRNTIPVVLNRSVV